MPLSTLTPGPTKHSNGDPAGQSYSNSSSDPIGFYGNPPIVQPSGNAQAALTRGNIGGSIFTAASTQSPTAMNTATVTESTMTVTPSTAIFVPAPGDALFVNKPTAQAGLGMGNVRVTGQNSIGVAFANWTQGSGATITPTAAQSYAVVAMRNMGQFVATLSPSVMLSQSVVEQQFTVTGIRAGELVQVQKPTVQAGLDIVGCRAVANNTLGITFANISGVSVTPTASEGYTVISLSGVDAVSNKMVAQMANGASPAAVGFSSSSATGEQSFTLTGITTSDIVEGITKPTQQANLGIVGYRVSGLNSLAITFVAAGQSATPTANEVYGVTIYRPAPVAPLVLYQATLTPSAVASQTTAEQSFTVTGVLSGTPVWVNKPSWTNGLGIAGVRASASNQIAINFANITTSSITPPSEVYTVGCFQLPIPDRSTSWVQPGMVALQQMATLVAAKRAALVSLGLIAGA
jgi:hypothetical protein